ncbi:MULTISPECIES: FTR1 family protein [Glaesserella]|uniref:Iron permease n=1 Tax=Glaesserella australis TaxID=2094024 RepID=A0A328C1P8_9PAST|nr:MULTISPECIES: FTR1 family protein [Glaesserella]AUI65726.1 iron permease [Glaesserella sp. 15-184]RAL18990.1 iron permease [Glaesserella australis]
MNRITWVKSCLNKFSHTFFTFMLSVMLSFSLLSSAYAKVETSHLFVHLSDAMAEVKRGEAAKSQPYLTALQQEFVAIPSHNSQAGQAVSSALNFAISEPNLDNFEQLSKALYAFEKEQNPVDYEQKRQQFAKRVMPVYQKLLQAVQQQDLEAVQQGYKRFNQTWTLNEKIVRETSLGHYGQIETAMTLLRIAMLSEPANFAEMQTQAVKLGESLADFKSGKQLQPQAASANAPTTLQEGIKLLEKSYQAFSDNQVSQGQADITLFIQQWAVFEGEVRTRDGALYNRVESDLPVILVKGNQADNLAHFRTLLDDLQQLDLASSYGIVDAMLILLREGTEALLIIMALLTTLTVARQPQAKRWVYAGAGLGVLASIAGAVALQLLFPAISAGTNREILEGVVGIVAVLMMLFVGAWLHSKSSLKGWQNFINKQVAQALATGSLFSMLALSFLSVFREGAETILFYAGMLPMMTMQDFLLGILFALILLAVMAWAMNRFSHKLPIHHLFKVMTLLIYGLGFKILGVSIQALQLTQILPRHIIDGVPNVTAIGFYSSWEGLVAQLIYIFIILVITKFLNR